MPDAGCSSSSKETISLFREFFHFFCRNSLPAPKAPSPICVTDVEIEKVFNLDLSLTKIGLKFECVLVIRYSNPNGTLISIICIWMMKYVSNLALRFEENNY